MLRAAEVATTMAAVALVVAIALSTAPAASAIDYTEHDLASETSLWALYERWCAHYNMARDVGEKTRRFDLFKENARRIYEHNQAGNATYTLGLNCFSDMTDEEFSNSPYGGCLTTAPVVQRMSDGENEELQQEDDGSFNLTDGGFMPTAFDFIVRNRGIVPEGAYPYMGRQGRCRHATAPPVTIDGYRKVPPFNANALMSAVAAQPVAVAIEAGAWEFRHYRGGVFSANCGGKLGHAATAVGYGADAGGPFWIVKNSWGPGWGEGGYVRISRNTPVRQGVCGILTESSYPLSSEALSKLADTHFGSFVGNKRYWKQRLCRVQFTLPSVKYRTLGKDLLCRVPHSANKNTRQKSL